MNEERESACFCTGLIIPQKIRKLIFWGPRLLLYLACDLRKLSPIFYPIKPPVRDEERENAPISTRPIIYDSIKPPVRDEEQGKTHFASA